MKFFQVIFLWVLLGLMATAETRVRISGMQSKSESAVMKMMGGRLEHVRSSPPSPPLADDAAFILRQLLRKDGYADAVVDWRITGPDEIELIVSKGIRLSLGQVVVRGAPGDEADRFAQLFAKPAETGRGFFADSPPISEQEMETGLSYLRKELMSRSHWQAEARITDRTTDPATGVVDVSIEVEPGPQFRIGRPTVTSTALDGAETVIAAASSFVGKVATTRNLNAMRLSVEEAVAGSGYPSASILMGRTLEAGDFIPGFTIELGERVRLGRLEIEGLERTNPERISDRFGSMEGNWYDQAAMNLRLRQFLTTGAFTSARVETVPTGDGMIDATLHFEEARAREITLGFGAGTYQGLMARAGYADRNLMGKLMGFNADLEMSFLGVLGEMRVTNPWMFGTDVSGSARAFALIYDREGYTAFESGLEGKLTWNPIDHYTVELLGGYSLVNLNEDGLPSSELGESVYTHTKLRLTQKLDFRDNPVLPKSGWYLELPLQIGAAVGDATTSYAMAGLSGGWYHKLNRSYHLGAGGGIDMLVPSGDDAALPIDLRLFNGGARSIRSFPERELGPEVNGYPTGGEAAWHTNFELSRRITDTVQAVAFMDAGSLSRKYGDIDFSDTEVAAGLGIRLNLPIGPVRFEYGYNLTRDPGEPAGTFHFAIGTAF